MLRNLTGFLFGFVIAICAGLAMLPAHSATPGPQLRGVLAMVLALDGSGRVIGAQIIGLPQSLAECAEITKQAQTSLSSMKRPPKVAMLVTACVDMHAAPGGTGA